jgi:uncharacterized protein YecE (DUF72 family)
MAGKALVGTCSWADKSLVECCCFYPPEAKTPEDRLRFYASRFPIVEIDSTYYGLPSERNAALWVERTPDDFTFDVKAFRLFTQHPTPPRALPKDVREALPSAGAEKRNLYDRDLPDELRDEVWRRYADALLPLDSAGKLGVVVFQFPPWFLPGRESKEHIVRARERLPQYRVAVEFRNGRWFAEGNRERTLDFLRASDIPLVCVDAPQGLASSVPPLAEVTSDTSVVRFHGRNAEMWAKAGASVGERFDYLYSEDELREWVPRVQRLAERTREVHLLMNNCVRDKAVVNAAQLDMMLSAAPS